MFRVGVSGVLGGLHKRRKGDSRGGGFSLGREGRWGEIGCGSLIPPNCVR